MSHMFPYDLLGGRVEEEKEAAAPPRRGRRRDRDRYAASDSPTSVPVVRVCIFFHFYEMRTNIACSIQKEGW